MKERREIVTLLKLSHLLCSDTKTAPGLANVG